MFNLVLTSYDKKAKKIILKLNMGQEAAGQKK